MNEPLHISVPRVCNGVIDNILAPHTYEVSITSSINGEFLGQVHCTPIHSSGGRTNYKKNDRVQVLLNIFYGGVDYDKNLSIDHRSGKYILGHYTGRAIVDVQPENPTTAADEKSIGFVNDKSGAGIIASDGGQLIVSSGGALYQIMNPGGYGIWENAHRIYAQNHHKIISHVNQYYLSREFFGMYYGKNDDDKSTKTDSTLMVNFRRFVTQSAELDKWVSSCEGSYAPWVGSNNEFAELIKRKETLFSKVINHEDKRLTIQGGDPGDEFLRIRIDKVMKSEEKLSEAPGAKPATLVNKCKINISDNGTIEILAGGQNTTSTNTYKFKMNIDADGNLTVNSAGNIILTHGTNDKDTSSLILKKDGDASIKAGNINFDATGKFAITANDFTINDKHLINEDFKNFMVNKFTSLNAVVGSPTLPQPLNLALWTAEELTASFITKKTIPSIPITIAGIIQGQDSFTSV